MGIIEGAVIGGGIGLVVSLVTIAKNGRWQRAFITAATEGAPDRARSLLDKHAGAPRPGKVPLNALVKLQARVAGLTILGDRRAIEDLLARAEGGAAYHGQVHALALVCLAIDSPSPALQAAALDEVTARVQAEASSLQKLLVKRCERFARLAHGLAGRPLDQADREALGLSIAKELPIVQAVLSRALAEASRRAT